MDDFRHLDHYALLGVAPGASAAEIKQAYRREIAKYHPDRYRHADPHTQNYARDRSQRINEAYAALSRPPSRTARPVLRSAAASSAEQIAMSYEQAQTLLAAGQAADALRLLRPIQKVDPLYRDVAELVERAEAATQRRQRRGVPPIGWIGAGALTIALIGGGVWASGALRSDAALPAAGGAPSAPAEAAAPPASLIAVAGSDAPSPAAQPAASDSVGAGQIGAVPAAPTIAPPTATAQPTAEPPTPEPPTPEPPTAVPPTAVPPTAVPPTAVPPTAVPPTAVPPSAAPPARTTALEGGAVLAADDFSDAGSGWASQQTATYTIGYRNGTYAVTAQPNIGTVFALGPALAQGNVIVGADVTPVRGVAGLIFGASNEYRFVVGADGSYRVEQRGAGNIVASRSAAISAGPNRLVLAAVGQRASVYANGTLLANLDLAAPLDGTAVGFAVVAGSNGGEGVFDNLSVRSVPR